MQVSRPEDASADRTEPRHRRPTATDRHREDPDAVGRQDWWIGLTDEESEGEWVCLECEELSPRSP